MDKKVRLKKVLESIRFHYTIKTQKEIANLLGYRPAYLSDVINGSTAVSDSLICKLSQQFGVNPSYITDGIEPIFNRITSLEEVIGNQNVQQISGDNNTSISGNDNQVNSSSALENAINEISAMRKIIEEQVRNNQNQFDRFMAVIEKLTLK